MKAELFFEKLFTKEMYLVPECGNYIYRSVPTKPYGWNVWRKTIGGGEEQPYDWKEDVGIGCWLEAVMMRFPVSKERYDNFK